MPDPVTIVSGLPRSGTSMMMRMIEAGGIPALTDQIRQPDEDNPNGYYEFEAVKKTKQDSAWVEQAGGKVVKLVHMLLPDLPKGREYRVVMMQRDLDEVLASQAKMLARSGKPSAPADTLKRVYTQQLDNVRRWMTSTPGVRSIEVSYNRMLSSPETEAARVAEFLGIAPSVPKMIATVDPSLYRNRRQQS